MKYLVGVLVDAPDPITAAYEAGQPGNEVHVLEVNMNEMREHYLVDKESPLADSLYQCAQNGTVDFCPDYNSEVNEIKGPSGAGKAVPKYQVGLTHTYETITDIFKRTGFLDVYAKDADNALQRATYLTGGKGGYPRQVGVTDPSIRWSEEMQDETAHTTSFRVTGDVWNEGDDPIKDSPIPREDLPQSHSSPRE